MQVILSYSVPRNSLPLADQEAALAAKPNLAAQPDLSVLENLDLTVDTDIVSSDADNVTRVITLSCGAQFLANYENDEAKKSATRQLFRTRIEALIPTACTAAEPVIAA